MKKNQLIIILILVILILALIAIWNLPQEPEEAVFPLDIIRPGAEEDFHSYLELPSRSGKFLEFDEDALEISILYFDTETMKTASQSFKIDRETILSKSLFELDRPNLFPLKTLQQVKQETQSTVFYLSAEKENQIPAARLIQVKTSF